MYRLALWIFVSSIALAQKPPADEIALAAKSPTELARYIKEHKAFNWDELWNALGTRAPDLFIPPCGVPDTGDCTAALLWVKDPEQEILIIQNEIPLSNDIYLRYLRAADGSWKFSGAHRAWVRNDTRRHQLDTVNGKPYLKVADDRTQGGFALQQTVEEWFDLTSGDFKPVFSYTMTGSFAPFSLMVGRTLMGTPTVARTADVETIELIVDFHFDGPKVDFPASYVGIYERPGGRGRFTLQRAYSGLDRKIPLPLDDFEGLAGVDFPQFPSERLLFYAFAGLEKIARGSNSDAREWLGLVLTHAKDCPEKQKLTKLLTRP